MRWCAVSCAGAVWTWPALFIQTPWSVCVFSIPGLIVAIIGFVGVFGSRR